MKKKTLFFARLGTSALLTAGLVFPLCSGLSVRAAGGTLSGDGSAGSPYLIQDEADLSTFASIVNNGDFDANARLEADINYSGSWTPIGGNNDGSAYTGLFLGNGHTVTFSSGTSGEFQGLFSYNNGTIQNVTVGGNISASDYAGGVAAVNKGTISGCRNEAVVSASAPVSFAGGITAVNMGTIENSGNNGSVSASASGSSIGGIAGAAREGTIKGCTNSGSVSLSLEISDPDYAEGCAGGIAGLSYKAAIERSANYGSVSSTDAGGYTGGVTGLNNGSIANCVNGAEINGAYYAGGIAGYNYRNEDAGNAEIRSVLNHGTVTANNTGYGAVCGVNHQGTVYDSYYLENTAAAGIGTSDNNGTAVKTADALKSGETAYQLNGNRSSDPIWYQTLNEDDAPVLDSGHETVYRSSKDGAVSYSNDPADHTDHEFGEDGVCDICGYRSVSLYGHSLTLDGALGMNYYYYIDPVYYQNNDYTITASFTINGRTETDTFDPSCVLATGNPDTPQVYGFQLYVNSDEMTLPIQAELLISRGEETVVTLKDDGTFRGYDYLLDLYENTGTYPEELQSLARAIATYDYYANEQFQYQDSYEPEIPLLPLDGVTSDLLQKYTQSVGEQEDYPAKHYALSMQFLSEHILYLYITSEETLDTDVLYMGYKTHGTSDDYTYVQAEAYGSYYRAATRKAPASELGTMMDCAFFLKQEDGSYKQITSVKTACPLSYASSALSSDVQETIKRLNQSLYLYYTESKAYFDSISQE